MREHGRVLIASGALAREVLALIRANSWDHIDLQCHPVTYHNETNKITPSVKANIEKYQPEYANVFIVYADCGTGGQLKRLYNDMGVSMISDPHCYSFYKGNTDFQDREELTYFYLTDFLACHFDAFFWWPMHLDRHPQLLEMYFENYTTLVYQAQDPLLEAKAQDFAQRM